MQDHLARLRSLPPLGTAVALTLVVLGASVAIGWLRSPADPLELVQVLAVVALFVLLLVVRETERRSLARRAQEAAGLAHMLQSLSRSTSADAIVQAIIADLLRVAHADHAVVVRRYADASSLAGSPGGPRPWGGGGPIRATLFVANPEVRPATIQLPSDVLEGGHPEAIATEIGRRMRSSYGLANPLAAPLVVGDRLAGVLLLSRRRGAWSAGDRRLLMWAAQEMSAALNRAYAFEAAETQARIDPLTGLPNRRYLEEVVTAAGPGRRRGDSVGALMVDIDHFKRLNDRYGHATGDAVLRAVADRIAVAVRASDTPARYGGEEFAVLLPRATLEQALDVGERIRRAIEVIEPTSVGVSDPITVSVGAAVARGREIDITQLLEAADQALYQAKRRGRNQVAVA